MSVHIDRNGMTHWSPKEKVWGLTQPLVITPMFEMHRLTISPGMRCSLHKHQFKHNAFYVLDGVVYIDQIKADHKPVETRILLANEWHTLAPDVFHQFRTKSDCGCNLLEMYYTEPLSEDIIRRNVGGPVGDWDDPV